MKSRHLRAVLPAVLALSFLLPGLSGAAPSAEIAKQLGEREYVYISSTRKDGTLSQPAEIWFLYHDGAVYVGTRPTSWRVKRIQAGRTKAKIWVGKQNGSSFLASGQLVKDAALEKLMLETFAKKYPQGWDRHAEGFAAGFQNGSRVIVKYTPE